MIIEDEELRITFKVASEEHLQKLDDGLLHLERHPDDLGCLDELMREAHSLKGDANMLGVKDIGTLAHQLEHILGTLKRGETELAQELSDRLSQGLDAIRKLVSEAVTGAPAGVNTFYALAHLMGAEVKAQAPPKLLEVAESLQAPPEPVAEAKAQDCSHRPVSSWQPQTPLKSEGKQTQSAGRRKEASSAARPAGTEPALSHQNCANLTNGGKNSPRYIQDDELRETFKIACEEHLQKLDGGLLHLEKSPSDSAKIEELLRVSHSIKGDAGMLGVSDVSTLAHQMENILNGVTRGEITLRPAICDCLSAGLRAIRLLVREAVTGEETGLTLADALALMSPADRTPEVAGPPAPLEEPVAEATEVDSPYPIVAGGDPAGYLPPAVAGADLPEMFPSLPEPNQPQRPVAAPKGALAAGSPDAFPAQPGGVTFRPLAGAPEGALQQGNRSLHRHSQLVNASPKPNSPVLPAAREAGAGDGAAIKAGTDGYRIETIRVETRNLDSLMTQAGELTVTKIRIAHRLAEIEEIVNLWEEWSRDTFVNRFAFEEIGRGNREGAVGAPLANLVQNLHHRAEDRLERLGAIVNRLRGAVYEDTARLEVVADELEEGIRTLRLLPLSTIFNLFPRMVRDLARQEGKQVQLLVEGGETRADKRILEEMKDPLTHMIRNAIDHGIETPAERLAAGKPPVATIRLRGYQTAANIILEVTDDGRGLDIESIKRTALKRGICREEEFAAMSESQIQSLIFAPGFSTRTFVTEVSGRGVGLDVVRTNVEHLKGTIQVESARGRGCTLRLQLGATLATAHVLLVAVSGQPLALPVEFVQMAKLVHPEEIFTIEGRETIVLDSQPVSVVRLADLLELPAAVNTLPVLSAASPCIILKVGEERLGLLVEALLDEQDVVLKPQSKLLKRVRNVAGATILGTGEVCMVLNPQDLIKSVLRHALPVAPVKGVERAKRKQVILLVEDSIATRTQEKRILESAGYEVVTAVDGLDGFNKLKTRSFDAVVSDIQMPNLDGLGLTAKIRQLKEYRELPIILVTSLASDEDKRRGAEAGANAYITKSSFNQDVLLETLRRLV
ncbi:hybrid sensor histidine kinase/response regulator [Kamptonema formosum]|uniref:hybrid sensor histidine kinase/response regulator n=1 Tax=Kamptonema formosum TaxID=331992 RepID=UPI00034D0313|nr:Hpt domain-containing protein [Oscillatoria sp. PCC 10802]